MKKAVCLLSGGLDSATALYVARRDGFEPLALTIDYGQIHKKEIECAKAIVKSLGLAHQNLKIQLPWKGSSLLDHKIPIPTKRSEQTIAGEIPSTYVPARNTLFLSFAASYAETSGAEAIFIGANALDYSGYPDCRPDYFEAFSEILAKGTKAGVEGRKIKIIVPLLHLQKKEIIELGASLNVPYQLTWSCYKGELIPCGECDSCILRAKGFREAGIPDPLVTHAASGN